VRKGEFLIEHPIESNSEGVDVALAGIVVLEDQLRGRGGESPDGSVVMQVLLFLKELLAEAEVPYLDCVVVDEDVRGFYIAVDDVMSELKKKHLDRSCRTLVMDHEPAWVIDYLHLGSCTYRGPESR
jgi:hypothetical protein